MRTTAIALLALSLSLSAALAQASKVGDAFILLAHQRAGWRIDSLDQKALKNFLKPNDVITDIDSRDARAMGPLGVRLALSSSYDRTVPLLVQRDGHSQKIDLWLSDGPAPSPKPDPAIFKDVSLTDIAPDFTLPALDGTTSQLSSLKG